MENYKENLKKYLKEDIFYQEYLKNPTKKFSDFEMYCVEHCKDIEMALEEIKKNDNEKEAK